MLPPFMQHGSKQRYRDCRSGGSDFPMLAISLAYEPAYVGEHAQG